MRGLKTGDVDGLSPYVPGGDIRMIDWRGFARSGQLRLKEREREAHSAIMLVADFGSHMRFGTAGGTLAFRVALTVARQAWIALRRDEPVGIATSTDGILVQPARGRRRLMHALDRLAASFNRTPEVGGTLPEAIGLAAQPLRSADELWAFSDFHYWSRKGNLPGAEQGRSGRWLAVQINDPVHDNPPPPGSYPARSMVDGEADEDLYLSQDNGNSVEQVAGRLNRELEAQGWRIGTLSGLRQQGWSNVA